MKMSGSLKAVFSTKKAISNSPAVLTKDISKLWGASTFSTAYKRSEGSKAVNEGLNEEKQEALDVDEERGGSGVSGFMAEKAKDGAEKAKEMAENVGDTAKKSMDKARKAAQETTQHIKEAVVGDDKEGSNDYGVNWNKDNVDNVEDLRKRAGGYDKERVSNV